MAKDLGIMKGEDHGKDLIPGKSQLVGSELNEVEIRSGSNDMGLSTRLDSTRMDCELEEEPIINEDGKKRQSNRMEKIMRRCGFFNGVDIPADGTRGGLSIGRNGSHLVSLNSFSKNHIDVKIQEEEDNPRWRFTGFYGAPNVREKVEIWDLL
ncbi:reverse transcriptase [Gossypium australe]|uniref:Reverse transcriptase n=1 Tax=Gossypium australe TaxID=47621 RepID=A0A5B6VR82_9ROSI|nr:reverse transcriptase [Gossypium australe]